MDKMQKHIDKWWELKNNELNDSWRRITHPERRYGEVWLGNFIPENTKQLSYSYLRIGNVTYDLDRKRIPEINGLKPVFVDQGEYTRKENRAKTILRKLNI